MNRVDIGNSSLKPTNMTQEDESRGLSSGRKRSGRVLIKELNENDVLQGRGSGSMQNTGNIKFRNLVEQLRPAYVATSSRKEKAKMISDMVRLIQSRKGRFLQRLCDKEIEKLGLDSTNGEAHGEQDHYVEMTDEEAAEKAKQAIRYVHYKKVPLEEERRKKRAADGGFLNGDNKNNSNESTHGIGYGGNSLGSAPISTNLSQVPQSNLGPGVTFSPSLPQPDINQLLASFHTAQNTLATQFPVNALNTTPSAQQASVMKQLASGIIPMAGNVQQQSLAFQQLATSLVPGGQPASSLLDNSGTRNANQSQLSQQQNQANILLQGLLHQQASAQQSSILHTILQAQQKQEQNHLNSALQNLQRQQQLMPPTTQPLLQSQKPSDPKLQQQNAILASLLSTATTTTPVGATMNPLMSHPTVNSNPPPATVGATNALLVSLLSNNTAQKPAFQPTGNSQGQGPSKSNQLLGGLLPPINNSMNSPNAIQQKQGLPGASNIQGIPGLAQNVDTLLAANQNNSAIGQAILTNANRSTAKRPRLSSVTISEDSK